MHSTLLSTPVRAALSCAALLSVIALTAGSGPALATTPHGCRDVMFIGARGSGEPLQVKKNNQMVTVFDGVGEPIDYMAKLLKEDVEHYGEKMGILPVIYRADSVDDLKPSKSEFAEMALGGALAIYYERNYKPYAASIADGVSKTIDDIHATLSLCPETELVLAGYSQGAMAVHQAELRLEREGDEEALDAIGGTLLLGDGDRVPNTEAKIFGGAPAGSEGNQVYLHGIKPADVAEPETTAEICARGDIVCDFKLHLDKAWYQEGAYVHTHYKAKPQEVFLSQAVAWLAEEMGLTG
jgi:hypothetical protein